LEPAQIKTANRKKPFGARGIAAEIIFGRREEAKNIAAESPAAAEPARARMPCDFFAEDYT
jgi:hypothetical protein